MGIISKWRAKRQAKKGGYVKYDTTAGTATYVPKPGEAVQTTVPPKIASVRSIDYVGGGGKTITTEGIGYTGGGGTTSQTITRTSPTGIITTKQAPILKKAITIKQPPTELLVRRAGGIQVGERKFFGGAEVPFTKGQTARQVQASVREQARAKGFKRGTYQATIPINQGQIQEQQFQRGQQSAGELLFGGDLVQPSVETGIKGFFGRVKERGQERYALVKEGAQDISGTYGGTYSPPSPYGSYARGFVQEIPSSFPKIKDVAQDVKTFFKPQIQTAKIGIGVIGMGAKKVGETEAYQKVKAWHTPRMQAVTSSPEFDILTKTVIRGTAFSPAAIVGRQTFVETIPLRQRKSTSFKEHIKLYEYKGKQFEIPDYTIYTEKAPPRIRVTRKMYEKPIDITYLPSIPSKLRTPYGASAKDPFITLEMKGGKVGSISEVMGTSQRITRQEILSYQKLTAPRKLLVERLAEAKAGSPVLPKDIPKFLTEKDMRFFSQIDVTKLGKARLTPSGIRLEPIKPVRIGTQRKPFKLYGEAKYSSPLGKTKTSHEAIVEVKLFKENEMYELIKSRILFKDVTKPFPRATGKTPELKGITYREKIPRILDDLEATSILKPADIKKISSGKTFQLQVQKQPTLFAPPKVPKAISTTKIISPAMETSQVVAPVSSFYGKGMYERTTGGQLPSTQLPSVMSYSYTQPITKTYTPSVVSSKDFVITKTMPSMRIKSYTKGITKPITKSVVKEITKPALKEITKVIQKPVQKLVLKQAQKTIVKPIGFVPITPIKIIPPRKPPTIIPPRLKPAKQVRKRLGGYQVQIRRFKKFKTIGKGKLKDVFGLGTKKVREELGATFRILSPKGKPISIPTIPKGFYQKESKKFGTLLIEKRKHRIKKRGVSREFEELQMWRKIKSPIKKSKGGKK